MNLRKTDPACRAQDYLQETHDLGWQVTGNHQNYEGNIESNEMTSEVRKERPQHEI